MSSVRQAEIELRPGAQSVPQNWDSLAGYLARFGVVLGPATPRQFAGGFGNLNYLVEIDGEPAVLRRPPDGPLPRGGNDMAREYRILASLWRAYPLAPRALFYCPETGVLGAPFQIIEYRQGIIIRDSLPSEPAGQAEIGATLGRHLVESLAALHDVDPRRIGLETLGRPVGFLGRTLEGWVARGRAVADLFRAAAFDECVAWLRRRVPPDRPPSLLHCDFKLDNMILEPASLAPIAVIDWDMGTRGDPLWDLAVLLSYWAQPGDPVCMHRMRQMPTTRPGFPRRREILELYQHLTGRGVDDFGFYRVLSLFRSAIVFLQLFDRYRRDRLRNPGCAEFGTLGRELLDCTFEITRGRLE